MTLELLTWGGRQRELNGHKKCKGGIFEIFQGSFCAERVLTHSKLFIMELLTDPSQSKFSGVAVRLKPAWVVSGLNFSAVCWAAGIYSPKCLEDSRLSEAAFENLHPDSPPRLEINRQLSSFSCEHTVLPIRLLQRQISVLPPLHPTLPNNPQSFSRCH